MAEVRPFAALRYDESVVGSIEHKVAPPYDVISDEERRRYLELDEHNVVRLTLPDSVEAAADEFRRWRETGALCEEPPSFWAVAPPTT